MNRLAALRRPLAAAVAVLGLVAQAPAAEPRTLQWEDLAVRLSAAENPFAVLPVEMLAALSRVAAARDRRARGDTVSAQQQADELGAARELGQAGIDADRLLAQRAVVAERRRRAAAAVNPALDGQRVRLGGFALPLEYAGDGRQVSEFLLLPWAGACIHTPPPDANQIVHVRPERPVTIERAFATVWVTGRLAARPLRRSVFLGDGASELEIGYALQAEQVQPYR